jgi:hypothetical protein
MLGDVYAAGFARCASTELSGRILPCILFTVIHISVLFTFAKDVTGQRGGQ